ncbi:MAG: Fic family protein [Lachnospiraceae bacterium]|nr:Fic family protein [Lachnospiraceae bacterium]
MELIDNTTAIMQIKKQLPEIEPYRKDEQIELPFTKDFSLRFCWSSNALEGNTLTLEETVSVIEYDEVRSGHTYSEYREAKNLYASVQTLLLPLKPRTVSEEWIRQANGIIMGEEGRYRSRKVYIGTLAEAVHYPPEPERVPELMKRHLEKWNRKYDKISLTEELYGSGNGSDLLKEAFQMLAEEHMEFEAIHPFLDGNGRTGRMVLNQRMMNLLLLPVAIEPTGEYRRAFRRYEKNGDSSQMVHILCKGELDAIDRMKLLIEKAAGQEELLSHFEE